ncbi:MAG: MFS transporter, partial [Acidimicrobiia bacterium]|nr:MFS transporter [Acidimicrobiia bacterium]
FLALFAGIVVMVAALDAGAGANIVTWPMLLAGLGVGALASQLGSVTVSAVPEEQAGEVGGLQNTITNLGASIGTALGGALLIGALTSAFLGSIQNNPDIPQRISSNAQAQLSAGIPFVSDSQLKSALSNAHVSSKTTDAIVSEYSAARLAGLRTSLSVLGVIALFAMFATRRIPDTQPGAASEDAADAADPKH